MPGISIGTLRYDIVTDSTRFVKGIRATSAEKKKADKIFRDGLTPLNRHNIALRQLFGMYEKGMVTKQAVLAQQKKIKASYHAEVQAANLAGVNLKKYSGSHATVSKQTLAATGALDKNTAAILRNKRAQRITGLGRPGGPGGGMFFHGRQAANRPSNRWANFGGSLGSGLGFGGPGAGIGRMAGMGAGFAGAGIFALGVAKMVKETIELESALVDMQSILGSQSEGTELVQNLRDIARQTPLTSKALIKGSQTLLGYGLDRKGLESTMYRIGEIAGGDTVKMDALTRAFAQVQSAGKLMGQEMLQLVNAGFPVAEIAKAAGVEMRDFRKEMEAGNISAHHLTKAMTNLTAEGGMFHGRLDKAADTIKGKWITAMGSIDQAFAEMGEGTQEWIKNVVQNMGEFSVSFIKGTESIFKLVSELRKLKGEMQDGPEDKTGMSGFAKLMHNTRNEVLFLMGYASEEINAYESINHAFNNLNDSKVSARKEEEKSLQRIADLRTSALKDIELRIKAESELRKVAEDSMKGETTRSDIKRRHEAERDKMKPVWHALMQDSSFEEAVKLPQAMYKRQAAELAAFDMERAKERSQAEYEQMRDLETARLELQKKNIKKWGDKMRGQVKRERDMAQRAAAAAQKRGGPSGDFMTAGSSYMISGQMQREYEAQRIKTEADRRRDAKLDEIKNVEERRIKQAERHHQDEQKFLSKINDLTQGRRGTP